MFANCPGLSLVPTPVLQKPPAHPEPGSWEKLLMGAEQQSSFQTHCRRPSPAGCEPLPLPGRLAEKANCEFAISNPQGSGVKFHFCACRLDKFILHPHLLESFSAVRTQAQSPCPPASMQPGLSRTSVSVMAPHWYLLSPSIPSKGIPSPTSWKTLSHLPHQAELRVTSGRAGHSFPGHTRSWDG